MSLWLEILQHAAAGNTSEAERLLNFELPLTLRTPEINREGAWQYRGPLPSRVRVFITTLSDSERGMATSRAEDLVDYIADLISAKVRRTVRLLEYCVQYPQQSISEIAEQFTGWDGMKRSVTERKVWITKHLLSMSAAGLPAPSFIADEIKEDATTKDDLYGYNELALVNQWKVDLSWADFKARQEIDRSYVCIEDSDSEEGANVGDESFDYGAITTAQVVLNLSTPATSELTVDLVQLGRELTSELLELLESFTTKKPSDGYRPIARHNVWWKIVLRYVGVPFQLDECDPFCKADEELAGYISKNYLDVTKPNRLNILRRRTRLQEKSFDHTQSTLMRWANIDCSISSEKE